MIDDNSKTGLLLNANNIKLTRQYFREMVKLLGINVLYRAPLPGKKWTNYGEIDTNFAKPLKIGCIFDGTPTQQTMKKLGWVAELDDSASIIHVDYDLPNLQVGALFIVPSGIDESKGRLFRVSKMTYSQIYPASITCEIVPEYEDTLDKRFLQEYEHIDHNLISEEHETPQFLEYEEHLKSEDVQKVKKEFLGIEEDFL